MSNKKESGTSRGQREAETSRSQREAGASRSPRREPEAPHSRRQSRKARARRKRLRVVLIGILSLLLLACAAVFFLFQHYYGKSNFLRDSDVSHAETLPEDVQNDLDANMNQEEQEEALREAQEAQSGIAFPNSENVYNILLIGSDRRDSSWYGNSDVMMLLSINSETETIHLTSFMRDSYAVVGDSGGHKLNYAYALGGGPLLVETIEENYKIDIDAYASSDFDNTADIIDLLGGVEIEVSSGEARLINQTARGNDNETLPGAGTYLLNGDQAVAYGRIRKIGNADYQRTERQREVMSKLFAKAKALSVTELMNLADEILPLVTHNLSEGAVASLLLDLPTIMSYDLVLDRVPYDGMYYMKGEMLVPDWEETIERLHENIYGES